MGDERKPHHWRPSSPSPARGKEGEEGGRVGRGGGWESGEGRRVGEWGGEEGGRVGRGGGWESGEGEEGGDSDTHIHVL